MSDINKANYRETLNPRNEPYWRQVEEGCSVGYRRTVSGRHTWVARFRLEGEVKSKRLGVESVMTWTEAVTAANQFFKECKAGMSTKDYTVEEICRAYVEDRRRKKGERTAADATKRFNKYVYDQPIGKTPVRKLRKSAVEKWHHAIAEDSTPGNANRYLRTFKAALNYGVEDDMAPNDRAWRKVKAFPAADRRRELYLSRVEMERFADQCYPWLGALLTGLMHVGARPGELRTAKVGDVDLQARTLKLKTKKGNGGEERVRYFPLANEETYRFFKSQVEGRFPLMPLFPNANGEIAPEACLSMGVKRIRRKYGWDDTLVAYTFRHSVISYWLSKGIPVADVASLAGTSIEKINDHYYKRVEDTLHQRLAAL